VAHGDHEVLAGEDVDLAELHRLGLVDVAGRAQDAEHGVAVAFELGALVGVDGVLDGQLVQVELARDLGELLARRPVQADPGDSTAFAAGRGHLGEVARLGDALSVAVDGAIDDHRAEHIPRPAVTGRVLTRSLRASAVPSRDLDALCSTVER
jgi:hypothetical protein